MSVPQSPDTEPAPKSALTGMRAFTHRDFRYFFATRVSGILATEMLVTTVGWQVYRLTASELNLGLIGLAQFAPFALLFLVSGVAADRLPRMRIILGASPADHMRCRASVGHVVGTNRFPHYSGNSGSVRGHARVSGAGTNGDRPQSGAEP